MKRFKVDTVFERFQSITVEANSAKEAVELVRSGEFEDNQISNPIDENVEVVGVTVIK